MEKVPTWVLVMMFIGAGGMLFLMYKGISFSGQDVREEKSLDAKNVDKIVIKSDIADIKVHPGTNNKIQVKLEGDTHRKIDFAAAVDQDVLRITVKQKRLFFSSLYIGNMQLDVYLPEKEFQAIQIESKHGDLSVDQKLVAEKLRLESKHGDIELQGYQGEQLTGKLKHGSLMLQDLHAAFDLESKHGDIEIHLANGLRKENRIRAKHGDVKIRTVEQAEPIKLNLQTKYGEMSVDFPVRVIEGEVKRTYNKGRYLNGVIGDKKSTADTPRLTVISKNGDIFVGK